jgi:hypothetical protein
MGNQHYRLDLKLISNMLSHASDFLRMALPIMFNNILRRVMSMGVSKEGQEEALAPPGRPEKGMFFW